MAVPVINPNTSVLGYQQFQAWEYQPFATNSPTRWTCPGLPAGLSIDTPTEYAVTGVASTDVLTATGNTFANGGAVVFSTFSGGAGLLFDTIYYVRDKSGDTFKLAATLGGAAINFTTDLSAGIITKLGTGLISGAATVPGVFVCSLTAHNSDGDSDGFLLTIGIEPAAYQAAEAAGLLIEQNSGLVYYADGKGGWLSAYDANGKPWPVLWLKRKDTPAISIKFSNGETYINPTLSSLKFGLKQNEPDGLILLGGGDALDTDFKKIGTTPADAHFVIVPSITGDDIDAALEDQSADSGTFVYALAEIRWASANPFGIGADPMIRRSRTFLIAIERNLIPDA